MPPYRPPLPPPRKPIPKEGTVPKMPIETYVNLTATHRRIARLLNFVRAEPAASVRLDPAKVTHVEMKVSTQGPGISGATQFLKFFPALRYNNPGVHFTYTKTYWVSEEEKARRLEQEKRAKEEAATKEAEEREYVASGRAAEDQARKELDAAIAQAAARKAAKLAAAATPNAKKTRRSISSEDPRTVAEFAKQINEEVEKAKTERGKDWPAIDVQDPKPLMTITFADGGKSVLDCTNQDSNAILHQLRHIVRRDRFVEPPCVPPMAST